MTPEQAHSSLAYSGATEGTRTPQAAGAQSAQMRSSCVDSTLPCTPSKLLPAHDPLHPQFTHNARQNRAEILGPAAEGHNPRTQHPAFMHSWPGPALRPLSPRQQLCHHVDRACQRHQANLLPWTGSKEDSLAEDVASQPQAGAPSSPGHTSRPCLILATCQHPRMRWAGQW